MTLYNPEDVRVKIKGIKLVQRLQAHIFDGLELSMSQVRAIEVLLRKVLPDLTAVAVKADVTHRFVAQLPDVLGKEEWIKRYGDPKQARGAEGNPAVDMDATAVEPIERVIWSPGSNYAQWQLLTCPVFEVFFGGARGGGKIRRHARRVDRPRQ